LVDVLFTKTNIIMENNMNKEKIIVPKGVRYISDWKEYNLGNYAFPHILNKVLTGCGFTEYCISNQQDLVLLSPRKFLLENKEDQHPGELYYAKNELISSVNYELDISLEKKFKESRKYTEDEIKASVVEMKQKIKDYCNKCVILKKPKKILVTYDSFRHVKEALSELGIFNNFQVVIDEFQSIFIDSRFKSDTELELLYHLDGVQKLCYVSATPMLDKYLDMLDEFKNLPYYELDWVTEDFNRIVHPKLEVRFTGKSLNDEAKRVIESYKKGNFEQRLDPETGGFIESHEATLFLNSVKGICQVIRTNRLHLNECNILCARTEDNEKAVRSAFNEVLKREAEEKGISKFTKITKDNEVIGRIPGKGELHKQFTICTRTVYLGADFYSTNSRTFIFSDANISCLSVDISMDLEQILGRQRLDENPWKNSATLYIKTTSKNNIVTEDEFQEYMNRKIETSQNLLTAFNSIPDNTKVAVAEKYEVSAKYEFYKKDYVAVNRHAGSKPIPVFNNLVLVSEIRAFEIQQIDYKDRFTVFASIKDEGYIRSNEEVTSYVEEFESIKNTREKLKYLVKFTTETSGITEQMINNFLIQIPGKYTDYYKLLGPDRIKANGYLEADLRREWIKTHSEVKIDEEMIDKIYETFSVGEKYGKASIKSTLKNIYLEYNFNKTAKASDLTDYFVLKNTTVKENGEWVRGFEILGKK